MSTNVGAADRVIRFALGVTVATLPWSGVMTGGWQWVAYLVAVVFLGSSIAGFCPVYRWAGWSTAPGRRPPPRGHAAV